MLPGLPPNHPRQSIKEKQEFPHFVIYNLWNSLKDNEMQKK